MTTETPDRPSVVQALTSVMEDVIAVRKGDRNQAQGFSFRGIDAVMNAVGPALRKHGVVILPVGANAHYRDVEVGKNRTPQRECTLNVRYRAYGPAGDFIEGEVPAEALDSGDKATSKGMSVAYRTFLLQALTIPTDEPDPDEHSVERSAPVEESPYISAENVASIKTKCEEAGVDVGDVVAHATSNRTANPAELYKVEVAAARESLAYLSGLLSGTTS